MRCGCLTGGIIASMKSEAVSGRLLQANPWPATDVGALGPLHGREPTSQVDPNRSLGPGSGETPKGYE